MTRGATIGVDQEAPYGKLIVWPTRQNKVPFDVKKENEVLLDARHEFIDENQASTSVVVPNEGTILEMPQIFKHLLKKTIEKVSKLE